MTKVIDVTPGNGESSGGEIAGDFGLSLRKVRESAGMSYHDLRTASRQIDGPVLSSNQMLAAENGHWIPPLDWISKYVLACGIEEDGEECQSILAKVPIPSQGRHHLRPIDRVQIPPRQRLEIRIVTELAGASDAAESAFLSSVQKYAGRLAQEVSVYEYRERVQGTDSVEITATHVLRAASAIEGTSGSSVGSDEPAGRNPSSLSRIDQIVLAVSPSGGLGVGLLGGHLANPWVAGLATGLGMLTIGSYVYIARMKR